METRLPPVPATAEVGGNPFDPTPSAVSGPSGKRPTHVPALDGVRGLAILLVMFFHMNVLTTSTAVDRAWSYFAGHGGMGVDIFFVLSGFLITGILLDAKGNRNYFRNFYARRILRIFPLYYLVVAFCLLILPHIPNPKAAKFGSVGHDAIYYWLHLSNFAIAARGKFVHGILDVSWSLAIEEQFYLVWPTVVLLFRRRTLAVICMGLVALAVGSRICLSLAGASPIAVYTLTFCRTDGLAIGALVALLIRYPESRTSPNWIAAAGWISLLVFAGLLALESVDKWHWLGTGLAQTLLSMITASVIFGIWNGARTSLLTRAFDQAWLRILGKYSYALYLFHYPLMSVVRESFYKPANFATLFGSQMPGQIIFVLIGIAISLGAAWLSYHLIEKQFLKLKRFFEYDRR